MPKNPEGIQNPEGAPRDIFKVVAAAREAIRLKIQEQQEILKTIEPLELRLRTLEKEKEKIEEALRVLYARRHDLEGAGHASDSPERFVELADNFEKSIKIFILTELPDPTIASWEKKARVKELFDSPHTLHYGDFTDYEMKLFTDEDRRQMVSKILTDTGLTREKAERLTAQEE